MKAILEDSIINVYNDENLCIGSIKSQSNFEDAVMQTDTDRFELHRTRSGAKIINNENVTYTFKTGSFFGNSTILETQQKIKGVFGTNWATRLIDKDNNTLVKIKNENKFTDNNTYILEVSDENISSLSILFALYGHLYGSKMKLQTTIIASLAFLIIFIGITA